MNKNDLIKAIHEAHGGISYSDAQKIMDLMLEIIKGRLVKGDKVLISGFGSFRVVKRKDRKGVNPQTGGALIIKGRKAVSFKPSKYLKSV